MGRVIDQGGPAKAWRLEGGTGRRVGQTRRWLRGGNDRAGGGRRRNVRSPTWYQLGCVFFRGNSGKRESTRTAFSSDLTVIYSKQDPLRGVKRFGGVKKPGTETTGISRCQGKTAHLGFQAERWRLERRHLGKKTMHCGNKAVHLALQAVHLGFKAMHLRLKSFWTLVWCLGGVVWLLGELMGFLVEAVRLLGEQVWRLFEAEVLF